MYRTYSMLLLCQKSVSKLCYDRRSVGQSVLVLSPLSGAPISDFCYCKTVTVLLMWGALSDQRTGLSFTIATCIGQRSHSWVWVPRDAWSYLALSDSRHPQPGGPSQRIYIPPRNRVGRLYPQALGSLSVACYDSQCYSGGIRTHLHAGNCSFFISNPVYNSTSIVVPRLLPREQVCLRSLLRNGSTRHNIRL
jgi:hypothetical protein